ncbi:MAG TPA: hypothetical protein VGU27_01630, partial [Candidatus Eisenbacteria bacterium]|nr:hypothetical protein [Candidatus Eisenbacteria bacterium]
YDGRTVAFAAVSGRDSCWRLWLVDALGGHLRPLTRSDRPGGLGARYGADSVRFARYDDLDPCWLPDGRIVFASTRWPLLAEAGPPATNLWVVNADGSGLQRLTSDRNGAETPSVDPTSGRIVYARWWFNRFRAAANAAGIVAGFEGALPADSVDLWHAVSVERDGDRLRLQGGDPRSRAGQMAYAPVVLADTTLVGVRPEFAPLTRATRFGLQAFPHGIAAARPLYGFGAAEGWSACAPAVLPDGRLVFAMDEEGVGRFGLFVCDPDGARLEPLVYSPDWLALDPAPLVPRPLPPGWERHAGACTLAPPPLPAADVAALRASPLGARFDCLNVFANAPVDAPYPDAIPPQRDVRIRFYTALARPGAPGNDSLALVAEAPVSPQGAVHVDRVPADAPMFEQLVDAHGHVLASAGSPAHVPGFNFTRPGAGTQCVGCHAGHSALPVPPAAALGEWTNYAPAARVRASSEADGTLGARAAVDRHTLGDPAQIAWVADTSAGQWLRLEWDTPLDARAVVLYAFRSAPRDGGLVRVRRSEVALFLQGHEVGRVPVAREWLPGGLRVDFPVTRIDALEVRPLEVSGRYRRRPCAALAEVECIARTAWE